MSWANEGGSINRESKTALLIQPGGGTREEKLKERLFAHFISVYPTFLCISVKNCGQRHSWAFHRVFRSGIARAGALYHCCTANKPAARDLPWWRRVLVLTGQDGKPEQKCDARAGVGPPIALHIIADYELVPVSVFHRTCVDVAAIDLHDAVVDASNY